MFFFKVILSYIKIIFLEFFYYYFSHQLMTIIKQYHMIHYMCQSSLLQCQELRKLKKVFNGLIQDI